MGHNPALVRGRDEGPDRGRNPVGGFIRQGVVMPLAVVAPFVAYCGVGAHTLPRTDSSVERAAAAEAAEEVASGMSPEVLTDLGLATELDPSLTEPLVTCVVAMRDRAANCRVNDCDARDELTMTLQECRAAWGLGGEEGEAPTLH